MMMAEQMLSDLEGLTASHQLLNVGCRGGGGGGEMVGHPSPDSGIQSSGESPAHLHEEHLLPADQLLTCATYSTFTSATSPMEDSRYGKQPDALEDVDEEDATSCPVVEEEQLTAVDEGDDFDPHVDCVTVTLESGKRGRRSSVRRPTEAPVKDESFMPRPRGRPKGSRDTCKRVRRTYAQLNKRGYLNTAAGLNDVSLKDSASSSRSSRHYKPSKLRTGSKRAVLSNTRRRGRPDKSRPSTSQQGLVQHTRKLNNSRRNSVRSSSSAGSNLVEHRSVEEWSTVPLSDNDLIDEHRFRSTASRESDTNQATGICSARRASVSSASSLPAGKSPIHLQHTSEFAKLATSRLMDSEPDHSGRKSLESVCSHFKGTAAAVSHKPPSDCSEVSAGRMGKWKKLKTKASSSDNKRAQRKRKNIIDPFFQLHLDSIEVVLQRTHIGRVDGTPGRTSGVATANPFYFLALKSGNKRLRKDISSDVSSRVTSERFNCNGKSRSSSFYRKKCLRFGVPSPTNSSSAESSSQLSSKKRHSHVREVASVCRTPVSTVNTLGSCEVLSAETKGRSQSVPTVGSADTAANASVAVTTVECSRTQLSLSNSTTALDLLLNNCFAVLQSSKFPSQNGTSTVTQDQHSKNATRTFLPAAALQAESHCSHQLTSDTLALPQLEDSTLQLVLANTSAPPDDATVLEGCLPDCILSSSDSSSDAMLASSRSTSRDNSASPLVGDHSMPKTIAAKKTRCVATDKMEKQLANSDDEEPSVSPADDVSNDEEDEDNVSDAAEVSANRRSASSSTVTTLPATVQLFNNVRCTQSTATHVKAASKLCTGSNSASYSTIDVASKSADQSDKTHHHGLLGALAALLVSTSVAGACDCSQCRELRAALCSVRDTFVNRHQHAVRLDTSDNVSAAPVLPITPVLSPPFGFPIAPAAFRVPLLPGTSLLPPVIGTSVLGMPLLGTPLAPTAFGMPTVPLPAALGTPAVITSPFGTPVLPAALGTPLVHSAFGTPAVIHALNTPVLPAAFGTPSFVSTAFGTSLLPIVPPAFGSSVVCTAVSAPAVANAVSLPATPTALSTPVVPSILETLLRSPLDCESKLAVENCAADVVVVSGTVIETDSGTVLVVAEAGNVTSRDADTLSALNERSSDFADATAGDYVSDDGFTADYNNVPVAKACLETRAIVPAIKRKRGRPPKERSHQAAAVSQLPVGVASSSSSSSHVASDLRSKVAGDQSRSSNLTNNQSASCTSSNISHLRHVINSSSSSSRRKQHRTSFVRDQATFLLRNLRCSSATGCKQRERQKRLQSSLSSLHKFPSHSVNSKMPLRASDRKSLNKLRREEAIADTAAAKAITGHTLEEGQKHVRPSPSVSSVSSLKESGRNRLAKSRCAKVTGDNAAAASKETGDGDAEEEEEEEEIIRCICNIYRDEGVMIQCDTCQVWQHTDCVNVSADVESYSCEQCQPREFSQEILMVPQPSDALPGLTYYLTLLRDDFQLRMGECVYLAPLDKQSPPINGKIFRRLPYTAATNADKNTLNLFCIERLWKDVDGNKLLFGHYYHRPTETFHESSRKFFAKEVFRAPRYDVVPVSAVVGRCCVLDLATYCAGRPKGVAEDDVYVCEYRVDRAARVFFKIARWPWPVNNKSYCFTTFEQKLQPQRMLSSNV